MIELDGVMNRIGQGMALGQRGEHAAACGLFAEIWNDIGGENGDPFHRCALAHAMADVQQDVHEELVWDLRALDAAGMITDERVAQTGVNSLVAGFYPSLHLNLGDCYRRIGDLDRAREHLQQGRTAVEALGDDGYAQMVRNGLDRLAGRLPFP